MRIRARELGHMEACVRLLAEVHRADAYPLHWPADPVRWLTPTGLMGAWVAEDEGDLLGHVALCTADGESALPVWEEATGLPAERLAVVAKFFVAPRARGRRIGRALLGVVQAEAHALGLRAVLEVLEHNRSAVALYEATGWLKVGSAPAPWAQGSVEHPVLHYFVENQ